MESVETSEIRRLAGRISGITVKSVELAQSFTDLAARFAGEPGTVVLLSGGDLDCARYQLLAIRPWLKISGRRPMFTVTAGDRRILSGEAPFEMIRQVNQAFETAIDDPSLPVAAGLFGYLAYDLKDFIEDLPRTSMDDLGLPDLCFFAPSAIVVHDAGNGCTRLCVIHREDENHARLGPDVETVEALLTAPPLEKRTKNAFTMGKTVLESSFTRSEYMGGVEKIKDYIVAGDIYQVNLSQRFKTDFSGDAFSLFTTLYQTAPGPFYAYVNAGDHQIVSTSPERFLKRSKNFVETRPIKGTRPRGKTAAEDRAFREDLLSSAKDDAELSMIVDLMRNDLGRVCAGGTVRVSEHRRLEAYHNVFHLVSVVTGELAEDKDSIDLIRATFPGGSITGCPRIRAMEIIDELEPVRRHVYTGSIGYISFHDTLDLSIAIRTATIFDNQMVFSVGGGVVFDSDPADEFEETLHKARSLMSVLSREDKRLDPGGGKWAWMNGKIVPEAAAAIPLGTLGVQYGLGFFETIRVESGRPMFLEDHVRRFYRAWDALLDSPRPDLTWEAIMDQVICANRLEKQSAAVKLMALAGNPAGFSRLPVLAVTARPYLPRPSITRNNGLRLATYPHPRQTPLADHKTLNYAYYYLAGKWAAGVGADEALILNPDGSVSETNTANILLIEGKKLVQPRSAHVLSGVMATRVVQYLTEKDGYETECRKIIPQDIFSANQVILTNALMGAVPVLSLDGKNLNSDPLFCQKIREGISDLNFLLISDSCF